MRPFTRGWGQSRERDLGVFRAFSMLAGGDGGLPRFMDPASFGVCFQDLDLEGEVDSVDSGGLEMGVGWLVGWFGLGLGLGLGLVGWVGGRGATWTIQKVQQGSPR